MDESIKKMRNDLRLSMNGMVSTSMREKGLNYKMNFGVNIPALRVMVKKYTPGKEIAEKLWREEVRELKIFATLLYPVSDFKLDDANRWVNEIPNQEIREQVCMNLFQELDFAGILVDQWTENDDEEVRTTGYWLFARLLITSKNSFENLDLNVIANRAIADLESSSWFLNRAAVDVLKRMGRNNMDLADYILNKLKSFESSEDNDKKEIYDNLSFEFKLFNN